MEKHGVVMGRWVLASASAASVACCIAAPPPAPPAPPARVEGPPATETLVGRAPELAAPPAPQPDPSSPVAAAPSAEPPPTPPGIPPNTAVLHVGDSFAVAGFAQALSPRMAALRVRYAVKAETSSYTVTWAAKMELLVANHQPDLVIISLGANEVENTDPPAHAPAVRRIVKAIGDRPCVWVSPPLWRKDTGIIDVIRTNSAPCRFFDSDALVPGPLPRQKDKIHPSRVGGARWAEAFWTWLQAERLPVDAPVPGDSSHPRNPWTLRPAPPEEHMPRVPSPLQEPALRGSTSSSRSSAP